MIAYQDGRIEGFEGLYAALSEDLRRYFASIVRDDGVAQDLVQDAFLEIHRARRTYSPPLPVRPWVFGVAKNVLRRHRRAAWRRSRLEARDTGQADERLPDQPAPGPSSEGQDIEEALRGLPSGRREAWVLHHVHGFSFRQIARRLGIGVGAAKLRSSRATKALRSALGVDRGERDE